MRINKNSSLRLVTVATLAAVAVLTGCGEKQQTPPPARVNHRKSASSPSSRKAWLCRPSFRAD